MCKTADTAERMVLRIMAYVFNKEYGKKYTNSEEKTGLVLFNKYPLQHIILGTEFCVLFLN